MLNIDGIGRLGQEPEIITVGSGSTLVKISLACDTSKKKEDGTGKESMWINAIAFGRTADIISQYYHKGYKIYFKGTIQNDKWIDKTSGQPREKIKVVIQYSENLTSRKEAEEMGFIDNSQTNQPQQGYQQTNQPQQGYQQTNQPQQNYQQTNQPQQNYQQTNQSQQNYQQTNQSQQGTPDPIPTPGFQQPTPGFQQNTSPDSDIPF